MPDPGPAQPRASFRPPFIGWNLVTWPLRAAGMLGNGVHPCVLKLRSRAFSFWLRWVFAVACGLLWLRCAGWMPCGTWALGSLTRDQTCIPCVSQRRECRLKFAVGGRGQGASAYRPAFRISLPDGSIDGPLGPGLA